MLSCKSKRHWSLDFQVGKVLKVEQVWLLLRLIHVKEMKLHAMVADRDE